MDTLAKVRAFVIENFYVTETSGLRDDESLMERGVVDSTGVLEVISFVEQTFDLSVSDDELLPENLDSIANIAAFVTRKQLAAAGGAGPLAERAIA